MWISVKTGNPRHDKLVLVQLGTEIVTLGRRVARPSDKEICWKVLLGNGWNYESYIPIVSVTYWQPLPEPAKN